MNDRISESHLARYQTISREAIKKARVAAPAKTHLARAAEDILDLAERYIADAAHFSERGDRVRALSAVNYAHGLLDAAARIGLLSVDHDSRLFIVDEKP